MSEDYAAGARWRYNVLFAVIVLGGIFLTCGGCVALSFWEARRFEAQVIEALNQHPVVREHVGEIADVELDLGATARAEEGDSIAFDVSGDKGRGVVTAEFVYANVSLTKVAVSSGTLRLRSGETHDLAQER